MRGLPPGEWNLPPGMTQRMLDARLEEDPGDDYCGCCGRPCRGDWCEPCAAHVLPDGPPWERTYEAQHGVPCPFQEDARGE